MVDVVADVAVAVGVGEVLRFPSFALFVDGKHRLYKGADGFAVSSSVHLDQSADCSWDADQKLQTTEVLLSCKVDEIADVHACGHSYAVLQELNILR